MGKSCLRFKKVEDLPLEAIGRIIADVPPDEMIGFARSARKQWPAARQAGHKP